MKTSKILTVFAALAVALSTLVLPAGAVEPSYKVSEYYKDTLYYHNLRAVELMLLIRFGPSIISRRV